MQLIMYTQKPCVQCNASYRKADGLGLEYEIKELTEQPVEVVEGFKKRNHLRAPVLVVVDDDGVEIDIWSGFNPDKIEEFAAKQAAAKAGELVSV